ncbi:hypothetical protein Entas_4116 [Enterobacter soli]|uniref:hypothetical protein n=1 Tax=Enterobacter soli TaxID=885040 RepID=UPI000223D147|nr:hypothetical protein [Enterobacter soli]AEN66823.1 hypothetical protein Entas_4116 [Enterobacter soli]OAT42393.1 hypothetical protein M987_00818 [Enterobacter soli ATCC BAA-2102]
MDIFVDIFLPKRNDKLLELEEQYHTWGDEKFPCVPREFKWKDTLSFVMEDIHSPYEKVIPNHISLDNYYIYSLNDDIIYEWERNLNKGYKDNNIFKTFILEYLSEIETWGMAISFDEDIIDGIDEFLLMKNENELVNKIESSINWNNGRGFIGYKMA